MMKETTVPVWVVGAEKREQIQADDFSWAGRIEFGAQYWVMLFRSTHGGYTKEPFFSRFSDSCVISEMTSDSFQTYCRMPELTYAPEYATARQKLPFSHLDLIWTPVSRKGRERIDSLLIDLPAGATVCPKCLVYKRWVNAIAQVGLVNPKPKEALSSSRDYEQYIPSAPDNLYLEALRFIYFEEKKNYRRPSIKMMRRMRFGNQTDHIVKELLDLGIITLHPDQFQKTIFIRYNEDLDLAVALEVLSWYRTKGN